MHGYQYLPTSLFGIPLEVREEPRVSSFPRAMLRDFDLFRGQLQVPGTDEFGIVGSPTRPDIKHAMDAVTRMEEATSLPCLVCSPELEYWQKEKLAQNFIGFVQDSRNLFVPFLGAAATKAPRERQPARLSAQAQRIFLNVLTGIWADLTAGELAERVGKSRASVSKYLAELASVSPSLIEESGRDRIVRNPGLDPDELFERFEPYLSSPVRRTFTIARVDLLQAAEQGFLLGGMSALETKTDLSFDLFSITVAAPKNVVECALSDCPDAFRKVPWHADDVITVQELKYPIDRPDRRLEKPLGIGSIDDLNLYLSLKNERHDDVRVQDAIEQVRNRLWL